MPSRFQPSGTELATNFLTGALQEFQKILGERRAEQKDVRAEQRQEQRTIASERREDTRWKQRLSFKDQIDRALAVYERDIMVDPDYAERKLANDIKAITAKNEAELAGKEAEFESPVMKEKVKGERAHEREMREISSQGSTDKRTRWLNNTVAQATGMSSLNMLQPAMKKFAGVITPLTEDEQNNIYREAALLSNPDPDEPGADVKVPTEEEALRMAMLPVVTERLLMGPGSGSPITSGRVLNQLKQDPNTQILDAETAYEIANSVVPPITNIKFPELMAGNGGREGLTFDDIVDALYDSEASPDQINQYLQILNVSYDEELYKDEIDLRTNMLRSNELPLPPVGTPQQIREAEEAARQRQQRGTQLGDPRSLQILQGLQNRGQ